MRDVEVKITDDGSTTLYHKGLDEHYHSVFGAVQEAKHVYIQAGLQSLNRDVVELLEIGFGTGLNALLSWQWADEYQKQISYTTLEYYPIGEEAVAALDFGIGNRNALHRLHQVPWQEQVNFSTCFSIQKIQANLLTYILPKQQYDLVYYDAFAPDKQPEMWTEEVLAKVVVAMKPQAILVTYSTKGLVKQRLRTLGLHLTRLPGPPGKRDMLFAQKKEEKLTERTV